MNENTTDLDEQILLALAKPYLHERAEAVEQLISNREKLAKEEEWKLGFEAGVAVGSGKLKGIPWKDAKAKLLKDNPALRKELDREESTHE